MYRYILSSALESTGKPVPVRLTDYRLPVPVNVIESATVYALEKSTSISGTGTRNSLYQTIDALTVIVFLSLQSENREYLYFVQWNIDRRHYDIYGK